MRDSLVFYAFQIFNDLVLSLLGEMRPKPSSHPGGAEGVRTPDPRLAKPMLSQLSYSPFGWAWQDLNLRPHAYQACALTT